MAVASVWASASPGHRQVVGAEVHEGGEALGGVAAPGQRQVQATRRLDPAEASADVVAGGLGHEACPRSRRWPANPPGVRLRARPLVVTTSERGEARRQPVACNARQRAWSAPVTQLVHPPVAR